MRDEERRLIEILLPGEIREIPTRFQDLRRRRHRRHRRRRRQRYFRRKMHARFSLLTFYGGLLMVSCPFPRLGVVSDVRKGLRQDTDHQQERYRS